MSNTLSKHAIPWKGITAGLIALLLCLLWLLVGPYKQKAHLIVSLETDKTDLLQVFWNNSKVLGKSAGYSEKDSIRKRLRTYRVDYDFFVPSMKKVSAIRIDPVTKIARFSLYSIRISQAGFEPIIIQNEEDIATKLQLTNLSFEPRTGGGLDFKATGDDPKMVLKGTPVFSYSKYIFDKKNEYLKAIPERMDMLGLTWPGLGWLGLDILLLLSMSATLIKLLAIRSSSSAEVCLFAGLNGLAIVLFSVMALGSTYLLTWKNILFCHTGLWFLIHSLATKRTGTGFVNGVLSNFKEIYGGIAHSLNSILFPSKRNKTTVLTALLLASVLVLMVYYLIPAALTLPLNFDSNDYRLSRVGYWLQEAHIWQFPSNDIRQIIMPPNCDLAMLWITSFFQKGYPLVHLISFFGGVLVCWSIFAICRVLQFSRLYSLLAVVIWLGIPNSAVQMLTSQTDLFTTGCLMAGLYFLYQAINNSKEKYYFVYAGIGIGLSVGAKSTVLLWGPGLVFLGLAILVAALKKIEWAQLGRGILLFLILGIVSGGFIYGQNYLRYQHFLGPKAVVASIDVKRTPLVTHAELKEKKQQKQKMSKAAFVALRAQAYLWQIFEPSSNLSFIHPLTDRLFNSLEQRIYQTNKTLKASFVSMFKAAASWLRSSRLSEDYASFGFLPFFLLFAGGGVAFVRTLRERDRQSVAVFVMFGAVILYMAFFAWVVGWTIHRYRYAVLVTPFIAVIGMYLLSAYRDSSKKYLKYTLIAIAAFVTIYQGMMAFNVANNSRSHGWRALRSPEKVHSFVFYWRDARHLIEKLPEEVHRLGLVLAKGAWKSMFYRTGRDIKSYTIEVDDAIDGHYSFLQRHNVDALITKKLSSMDIHDHFNVLSSRVNTYQALIPAEKERERIPWIIPSGAWRDGWVKLHGAVRIGNWHSDTLTVSVCNPAPVDEKIVFESTIEQREILLAANSECEKVDIPVNDNDHISWDISPGYHPWKNPGAKEVRSLGVKMKFPKPEE